jgi:hypothetical protein
MIRKVTDKSRGIRLGNYVQIRTIEDEELEQVWAGKKTGKQALDSIVSRGNELLARFERSTNSKPSRHPQGAAKACGAFKQGSAPPKCSVDCTQAPAVFYL